MSIAGAGSLLMKRQPSLLDEYDRSDFGAAHDPSPARRSRLNRQSSLLSGIQTYVGAARHSSAVTSSGVARGAKGNEVLLGIIARVTAKLSGMDFQV